MTYKKWDIVLIPFPFTDVSTTKKRPGLVISPQEIIEDSHDCVIVFMTSKIDSTKRLGDYLIREWEKSDLPKPTLIRMKFATISTTIIIKKIGRLHQADIDGFNQKLQSFFIK